MRRTVLVLASLVLSLGLVGPALALDSTASGKTGGVTSLEDRIEKLEEAVGRKVEGEKWYDRIQISGLVEVEAGYGEVDFEDSALEDEKSSDVDLATVELALDAKIHAQVEGHVLIKYEEDDLFVDEGFITLTGPDRFPAYLIAGRQYVPFGNFDTHFVTDPNTLILGETNEGAAVVGYRFMDEMLEVSAGAFNGEAREAGDDDAIDSFVAAMVAKPFEGLNLGVSYISNLAGSNSFNEEVVDPENLDSLVGGWSAFVSFSFLERFKLIAEYVGALDNFRAGEIYGAADGAEREPSAWNAEFGVAVIENVELALRYGGSDDGGFEFLPETQYGAVVNWGFFDNTNLAVEYLHGEFEEDYQETDTITAQLAIAF
ncbi:MAG: LbtU family siderophore porin [Desulfatitalea sp.]